VGYIDDITLGGTLQAVAHDVETIKRRGPEYGLFLNESKCELISTTPIQCNAFEHFIRVNVSDACLLGAPLFAGNSLNDALQLKLEELNRFSTNIRSISAHDALLLMKYSFSSPRILHLLRCSPCHDNQILLQIDNLFRNNISHIANVDLSETQWSQASLPARFGGLGIRRATSLALPAFLSSVSSTTTLQNSILSNTSASADKQFEQCCLLWSTLYKCPLPSGNESFKQRTWDSPAVKMIFDELLAQASEHDKARLLAVSAAHSSDWLNALPISSCGLRLQDDDITVAVGFRLGTAICKAHSCPCGAQVEVNGLHGLSCKKNSAKQLRHHYLNDLIYRAFSRAGIPASKEPNGLSRADGKRPDGMSLIPWKAGKCVIWDVTVADTMAQSYVAQSSISAGSAAEMASSRKESKYAELSQNHLFVPLAFETLGPTCHHGHAFLQELGHRMTAVTGDVNETSHLFQRLSMAIQRFHCIMFKNSFVVDADGLDF
jgi:hypothetical protein